MSNVSSICKSNLTCCGCCVCEVVCPTGAISVLFDNEGFMIPTIDNQKCVNCSKCSNACPIIKSKAPSQKPKHVYGFLHSNDEVWQKSASGGAFTGLVQSIMSTNREKNIYVYAATFDGTKIVHALKPIHKIDDIDVFRKSKYVQSDFRKNIESCYKILADHNNFLVFVGTPCQNYAFMSLFQNKRSQIFMIDFVCHGVGSPGVFDEFCGHFYKKQIIKYEFRHKRIINRHLFDFFSIYQFKGESKQKIWNGDAFNRLFLKEMITRGICNGMCPFRISERISDVTIADFRNKKKWFPSDSQILSTPKNISMIIPNSSRGISILETIGSYGVLQEACSDSIAENPLFYSNKKPSEARINFFQIYNKKGLKKAVKTLLPFFKIKKYKYIFDSLRNNNDV